VEQLQAAEKVVLDRDDVARAIVRMAHEVVERNTDPDSPLAIVGIHRRGVHIAERLHAQVAELLTEPVALGSLDIAFHRDDLGRRPQAPIVHATAIDFALDGATVVIVDDVLFTGRTVRAAIDALFEYGRPGRVQLAVLVDRGHRELPIRPDYVGKNLPTSLGERVNVRITELDGSDQVTIGAAKDGEVAA
jgi:pyrimidine operon attenuation protein / uracil phosphoribosyltransferase